MNNLLSPLGVTVISINLKVKITPSDIEIKACIDEAGQINRLSLLKSYFISDQIILIPK